MCLEKEGERTNKFLKYRYFIENPKSTPLQFTFVFIKHSLHQSGLIQKKKKFRTTHSVEIEWNTFMIYGQVLLLTYQADIIYNRRHFANSFMTNYCTRLI